jgi:cell division protein FtsL
MTARSLWLTGFLLISILSSALAMAWTRFEIHREYAQLHNLRMHRDALDDEWGRLLLEQATWATSSRIERIAHERLGLKALQQSSVVMIRIQDFIGE